MVAQATLDTDRITAAIDAMNAILSERPELYSRIQKPKRPRGHWSPCACCHATLAKRDLYALPIRPPSDGGRRHATHCFYLCQNCFKARTGDWDMTTLPNTSPSETQRNNWGANAAALREAHRAVRSAS